VDDRRVGPRRGGQPLLTDPDALAEALRRAFPDAEPFEVAWDDLARAVRDVGADPGDDRLITEALIVWESLM
jgi:hypothetical protein